MKVKVIPLTGGRSSMAQWFMTALVTASLFFAVGCSNSPLSPPDSDNLLAFSSAAKVGSADKCHEGSGLVTPEDGGVVLLGWAGPKNRLEFAPGAVGENVTINVTTCVVKGNAKNQYSAIVFDCGPDSLTFDPPAKIVINAGSLNSLRAPKNGNGVVKLLYYDPDTDEWLVQQEATIEKGKVTFTVEHFSKWGISH